MPRTTDNERTQAFVDLLDRLMLRADGDVEQYKRVLHYEPDLRNWFLVYPGWRVERSRDLLRLVKVPVDTQAALQLGLKEKLDYVLFTLVLYMAEIAVSGGRTGRVAGEHFLLSMFAEELSALARVNLGEGSLDFGQASHRRSMVRVMRLLEETGAIIRLDGSATDWAEASVSGDVLYSYSDIIYQIGRVPRAEETVRLAAGIAGGVQASSLMNLDKDQRAWRALLLGPALFAVDDEEAYRHVVSSQVFFGREVQSVFGWFLDVQRGVARILRESRAQDASGVVLSARHKSEYVLILLFCARLREMVNSGEIVQDEWAGLVMPASQFSEMMLGIRDSSRDILAAGLATCPASEVILRTRSVMISNGMLKALEDEALVYLTPLSAMYKGVMHEPDEDVEESQNEQLALVP